MTITLADLRKLPPSPELFALMRREWPAEQRRKAARKALMDAGVQVVAWEAEWLLERLPKDPPEVTAARRKVLEDALAETDSYRRPAKKVSKEAA